MVIPACPRLICFFVVAFFYIFFFWGGGGGGARTTLKGLALRKFLFDACVIIQKINLYINSICVFV